MDFNQLMMRMRELDQPAVDTPSTEACGDMPPMGMSMPPKADEPAPSMSVNLNAQGLDNIEELMKLIMKVNPEMEKPELPSMPSISLEPEMPSMKPSLPPLKMLPDFDKEDDGAGPDIMNKPDDSDDGVSKAQGDLDNDGDHDMDDHDMEKKKDKEEEFANEPDVDYKDADYMNNKLAGGMNRQKSTFPKVADGDNPMQKKQFEGSDLRAQIRAELLQRLAEAKGAK